MGSILWILANEKPPSHSPLLFPELCLPVGANGERPAHLELVFFSPKQQIKAMVALALCAMVIEGGGGGTFVIVSCVISKWFALSRHALGTFHPISKMRKN